MLKVEEILDKLIGHTDIWCETNYDNESYDNIENLFKVLQWALDRIEDNMRYLNRIEYSAQEIVRLTSAYWHNDCKLKTEKISELVNKPEKYIKYFDDNFCNYNLYLTIKKIQRYVKFLGIYKLKTIYKK